MTGAPARVALAAVAMSALAIAVAYAAACLPGPTPAWTAWVLAGSLATLFVAMLVLGACRQPGALRRLALPLALLFVVLAGGFGLALALPPEPAADPALVLGLPRRAAIVLLGVGLLPVLILPLAYALTFDTLTLTAADLAAVDALRAGGRDSRGPAPDLAPPAPPAYREAARP